jgi:hypothetical protein
VGDGRNGWRSGTDPILRWLRAGTVIAFVVVVLVVALDRDRDTAHVLAVLGIVVGSVLILLGYQGVVRLPVIGRDDEEKEDEL